MMPQTTRNRNGNANGAATGTHGAANRLPEAFTGRAVPGERPAADKRPVVAVFCYEGPDSTVGRAQSRLSAALVRRGVAVHLFARHEFPADDLAVTVHAVGDPG